MVQLCTAPHAGPSPTSGRIGQTSRVRRPALIVVLLALATALVRPAGAATPSYVDSGTNADGYHQITLYDGGLPPPADTSSGPYKADIRWTAADGRTRTYRIIVPPDLPRPAPYVVGMGGLYLCLGNTQATQAWEQHPGVAVVYAQGVGCSFNAGRCCGQASRDGVDDVAYLRDVLRYTDATWPRDGSRTMVAGFSNGGMMAYRFACEQPSLVSAVGVDAGTDVADCRPDSPVAVRHVHGGADTVVPYDGTENASYCSCELPPVPSVLAQWQRADRATGTPVEATALPAMGHRWATAADGLDATGAFLDFLAAHPRT
jgi:polyhydroxybutyrate depolymerase